MNMATADGRGASVELAWQEFALCVDTPLDWWYIGRGESPPAEAAAMCDACPAWKACRDWALRHEKFGIWAGTSERQRRILRRQSGIRLVELEVADVLAPRAPAMANLDDDLEEIA
jgi:WhiB family redox-sensing transcriptional regulator